MPRLARSAFEATRDVAAITEPALPVLLGLLAAAIVGPGVPTHAEPAFYGPAAEVGIVLLVAIALEARLLGIRGRPALTPIDAGDRRWVHVGDVLANLLWRVVLFVAFTTTAVLLVLTELSLLLTLAEGAVKHSNGARTDIEALTVGLVAVGVAGVLIARNPPDLAARPGPL